MPLYSLVPSFRPLLGPVPRLRLRTDTRTHTQDNYRNPPAHARRGLIIYQSVSYQPVLRTVETDRYNTHLIHLLEVKGSANPLLRMRARGNDAIQLNGIVLCTLLYIPYYGPKIFKEQSKMASADLSFTKDGLIYRPGHHHEEEEEPDDFLAETSHRDGGVYAPLAHTRS